MLCAAATSPPKKQTSTAPEEQKCEVRIRNPLGLDSTRFNPRFNPNWNVAPTHQVPALRRADPESDAGGAVVESCAVITVPANAVMNVIDGTSVANGGANDGRMPAILTVEAQEAWLHGSADEAFACLTPYSDELTIAHKVSSRVNSVKNNDEGLAQAMA